MKRLAPTVAVSLTVFTLVLTAGCSIGQAAGISLASTEPIVDFGPLVPGDGPVAVERAVQLRVLSPSSPWSLSVQSGGDFQNVGDPSRKLPVARLEWAVHDVGTPGVWTPMRMDPALVTGGDLPTGDQAKTISLDYRMRVTWDDDPSPHPYRAQIFYTVSAGADIATSYASPNPFRLGQDPSTEIAYYLDGNAGDPSAEVCLAIRDAGGALVYERCVAEQPPGWKRFSWDGRDVGGKLSGVGQYRYEVRTGTQRVLASGIVELQDPSSEPLTTAALDGSQNPQVDRPLDLMVWADPPVWKIGDLVWLGATIVNRSSRTLADVRVYLDLPKGVTALTSSDHQRQDQQEPSERHERDVVEERVSASRPSWVLDALAPGEQRLVWLRAVVQPHAAGTEQSRYVPIRLRATAEDSFGTVAASAESAVAVQTGLFGQDGWVVGQVIYGAEHGSENVPQHAPQNEPQHESKHPPEHRFEAEEPFFTGVHGVPGVTVTLENGSSATTDRHGWFRIPAPAGLRRVRITGFASTPDSPALDPPAHSRWVDVPPGGTAWVQLVVPALKHVTSSQQESSDARSDPPFLHGMAQLGVRLDGQGSGLYTDKGADFELEARLPDSVLYLSGGAHRNRLNVWETRPTRLLWKGHRLVVAYGSRELPTQLSTQLPGQLAIGAHFTASGMAGWLLSWVEGGVDVSAFWGSVAQRNTTLPESIAAPTTDIPENAAKVDELVGLVTTVDAGGTRLVSRWMSASTGFGRTDFADLEWTRGVRVALSASSEVHSGLQTPEVGYRLSTGWTIQAPLLRAVQLEASYTWGKYRQQLGSPYASPGFHVNGDLERRLTGTDRVHVLWGMFADEQRPLHLSSVGMAWERESTHGLGWRLEWTWPSLRVAGDSGAAAPVVRARFAHTLTPPTSPTVRTSLELDPSSQALTVTSVDGDLAKSSLTLRRTGRDPTTAVGDPPQTLTMELGREAHEGGSDHSWGLRALLNDATGLVAGGIAWRRTARVGNGGRGMAFREWEWEGEWAWGRGAPVWIGAGLGAGTGMAEVQQTSPVSPASSPLPMTRPYEEQASAEDGQVPGAGYAEWQHLRLHVGTTYSHGTLHVELDVRRQYGEKAALPHSGRQAEGPRLEAPQIGEKLDATLLATGLFRLPPKWTLSLTWVERNLLSDATEVNTRQVQARLAYIVDEGAEMFVDAAAVWQMDNRLGTSRVPARSAGLGVRYRLTEQLWLTVGYNEGGVAHLLPDGLYARLSLGFGP